MATRRRSINRRKATSKRTATKRKTVKVKLNPTVVREIWAIVHLSIGLLTVLSIQGAFGVVGDAWVSFLQPILGWGIYVIPGVFILVSLMLFLSKKIHFGGSRVIGLFFFMMSVLSVLHLSVPIESIFDYAAEGRYGGYVGFVTNFLLIEVLNIGRIGASVIFVAMFLVSLVLIFEVSLKEILALVVPKVKIEMAEESKRTRRPRNENSDEDGVENELDQVEDQPEIMIRKSQIGSSRRNSDDESDDQSGAQEVEVDEVTEDNLKMNFGDDEVSKELDKNSSDDEEFEWEFPSLDLLVEGDSAIEADEELLKKNADTIKKKLMQFGIDVKMHEVNVGPTVIQYTLKPDEGVKLSKITSLKNDLALALAAERIRVEAPIPGKSLVGIEVPNDYRAVVHLKEMLESSIFTDARSKLTIPLGRDVSGKPIIADLASMPHLLIAGATGSGKSVAMNSFLLSMLYQNSPKELRFIMIDPKRVELTSYNSIPHLLNPVIEDPEKAAIALRWVVSEMTRRYSEMSRKRVRNISEYNELKEVTPWPKIVVVIDELADLMMVAGKEVEASICRIAQMARAVGIHLMVATQRPSVDVITGLIKANIPSRISFAVSSSIDSRTIIDSIGAEDLLGRGDMLYLPTGMNKCVRIQGIYVSNDEINRVTNRVKLTVDPDYNDNITSLETAKKSFNGLPDSQAGASEDAMYEEAFNVVKESRKASASLLQRRLKVGYARAARLIDLLEENGVVGPADGAKPRKILVD